MIPFDVIADALEGIPYMSREQGWSVYKHVRDSGAREVLEIGCAHGVGACYMAAAIEGPGRVTTVDHAEHTLKRQPHPKEVIDKAGLSDKIELVLVEDSSYTWWLKSEVQRHSDAQGNCVPIYDFCYLDGAHNFTVDGLSVILLEKLLKPGGWLLLDDLDWTYQSIVGEPWFPTHLRLSSAEIAEPHMQAVFDLIIRQHPVFTETAVENRYWGWAHKNPDAPRRHHVVESGLPFRTLVRQRLRRAKKHIASSR